MALTRLGANQSVNLASNVTGTLPVANGGTAITSGFINGTATPGKVLQVANDLDSANIVLSTSSWTDTNLSISFTPVSASSKLLMLATIQGYCNGGSTSYYGEFQAKFVSGGSDVGEAYARLTGAASSNQAVTSIHEAYSYQMDSGSTSARTIKVQVKNPQTNQNYCTYNQYGGYSSLSIWEYLT
jgi:hypothetical protein